MIVSRLAVAVFAVAALVAPAAFAHSPEGSLTGGFAHGFAHPFGGLDHLLAMALVGLGAAQLVGATRKMTPVLFLAALAGLFALAHGLAHGWAMSGDVVSGTFVSGFLAASAALTGLGFAAAKVSQQIGEQRAHAIARAGGGALVAAGVLLLAL